MKTVLIYSGGLDSTVLLYELLRVQQRRVYALSIDYGQRHIYEISAAAKIVRRLEADHAIEWQDLRLTGIRSVLKGSSQTDPSVPVPHGHYAEESMKLTVVPNRNMILLAMAAAWAISLKADEIAYAAHAGDHAIYPDCRPEFADKMAEAIALADWHHPKLIRPFITDTKAEIVKRGDQLGVPFELTWSCYDPQPWTCEGRNEPIPIHCGKCGTCTERKEAFQLAQVNDPTFYQDTAHMEGNTCA